MTCASKIFALLGRTGMLLNMTFCLRTNSRCGTFSEDDDAAIAFDDCDMDWHQGASPCVPFASPGTFALSSLPRFRRPCVVRLRNIG